MSARKDVPKRPAAFLTVLVRSAGSAIASSDDAWAAFRAEVEAACLGILEEPGEIVIEINSFRSEYYGAAIVTATAESMGTSRMICIHGKATKAVERTAPF